MACDGLTEKLRISSDQRRKGEMRGQSVSPRPAEAARNVKATWHGKACETGPARRGRVEGTKKLTSLS
jgi:hypothetical protein